MKKRKIKYKLIFLTFFLCCLISLGNTSNVYALTANQVKDLKEGDQIEITKNSKIYYYGLTSSIHDIKSIQIRPGYEGKRIKKGEILAVEKVDGNKCYRKQGNVYYVGVRWINKSGILVHYSNIKKAEVADNAKEEEKKFLKTKNVKKVQERKGKRIIRRSINGDYEKSNGNFKKNWISRT